MSSKVGVIPTIPTLINPARLTPCEKGELPLTILTSFRGIALCCDHKQGANLIRIHQSSDTFMKRDDVCLPVTL